MTKHSALLKCDEFSAREIWGQLKVKETDKTIKILSHIRV